MKTQKTELDSNVFSNIDTQLETEYTKTKYIDIIPFDLVSNIYVEFQDG